MRKLKNTRMITNKSWLNEPINNVEKQKGIFSFLKVLLGKKKLTYGRMFLLLYGLNKMQFDEEKSKLNAFLNILDIYKFNNKNFPELSTNLKEEIENFLQKSEK